MKWHRLTSSQQKSEKELLLQEQTELKQNLEEMQKSLRGLCKNVSIESGSDQDHLHLLAKLSSPDFPISSPGLEGKNKESQITIEMVSCSSVCEQTGPPADAVHASAPQAGTEDAGCPVPLLNACLDMNNSL